MSDLKMVAATRLARLNAREPAYPGVNEQGADVCEKLGELYCKRELLEVLITMLERLHECDRSSRTGRAKSTRRAEEPPLLLCSH